MQIRQNFKFLICLNINVFFFFNIYCHSMVFVEEHVAEPVENGGGVSTRHKNPGPGAYTTVSVGDSLE